MLNYKYLKNPACCLLLAIGLFFSSTFATAAVVGNSVFDNSNPEKIVPTGNANGLSPTDTYNEYQTHGSPERNPVQWEILNGSNKTPTAYQTNKWYTDLTFYGKQRGSTFDDFRVAQSPFNLRILDTAVKNGPDSYTELPGLLVTAAKKPYLIVGTTKPTPLGISQDMYPQTLMVDTDLDLVFSIPTSMALDPSYKIERKIIVDHKPNQPTTDQLSFTTQWDVVKSGQETASMTAPIVRGAPYMTMIYKNMPVTFSGRNLWAIAAEGGAAESLPDKPLDKPHSVTGSTFRLVTTSVDNDLCSQKGFKDANGTPICSPILYNVYVLYASKPLTLTFKGTTTGDAPPPRLLFHQLSDPQPFNGVVRMAYAGSLVNGGPMLRPEEVAKAILDGTTTLPGLAEVKKHEAVLNSYANVYPVAGEVVYQQSGYSKAEVTFNWKTEKFEQELYRDGKKEGYNPNTKLLMTAFEATQLQNLKNDKSVEIIHTLRFDTLRGPMVGVVGHHWVQNISLPFAGSEQALWYGDKTLKNINPEYIKLLKYSLASDMALIDKDPKVFPNTLSPADVANDSYAFGKKIARLARLALIAEELGENANAKKIAEQIEGFMDKWFQTTVPGNDPYGKEQGYFKYDNKFGGILTARAATTPSSCEKDQCGYQADFYNGMYTDHHFHYGYFLYAAAVVAKFDPKWVSTHKQQIDLLARDIANPSEQDKYFPEMRMFDAFEGHGFANGLGPGASGRNQESSSESVNAWYSLALWGDVTKNPEMKALGLIMAAQEIQAAQAWTQIIPDKSIYKDYGAKAEATLNNKSGKDIYMKDDGATGINWSLKVDYSTFFGNKSALVLGIHMLPYTPITPDLIPKAWVDANQTIIKDALGKLSQQIDLYKNPDSIIAAYPSEMLTPKEEATEDGWKGFWTYVFPMGFSTGYQWGLVIEPILALGSHQPTDLYNTIFNVYPEKMAAINQAFSKVAESGKSVMQDKATQQYFINAYIPHLTGGGGNKYYWEGIGHMPFAKSDYRGIDNGMTLTNLLWWVATQNGQIAPPPAKEKFYVPEVKVSVNGTNLAANWQVIHEYKAEITGYKVSLYNTAQTQPIQEQTVTNPVVNFNNLSDGSYKVRVIAEDDKGNSPEPAYTDSSIVTIETKPVPPPEKAVRYMLVPAVTGTMVDSHMQLTFSDGIKELIVNEPQQLPRGARVLEVTAENSQPANLLVKVTNAANPEFSASCLLSLSSARWERASQQPADANCNNFPMGGAVDPHAEHTIIGVSTPTTKPTQPKEEFRVPEVIASISGMNLTAKWTVVHDFNDADVSYKVTLYNTLTNQPVREEVITQTTINFENLAEGKYKVRIAAQDTKGRQANPVYTDSADITLPLTPPAPPPPTNAGYYLIIPNFHAGKPDEVKVVGAELATPITPLPPGAVLISVATEQPKAVQIIITNTSPEQNTLASTASCTLSMSRKGWTMAETEKTTAGCGYFPHGGGTAGTHEVPVVIGVSTPK
jgi:endoglucanase Acf2